jgi:hypothetical protein
VIHCADAPHIEYAARWIAGTSPAMTRGKRQWTRAGEFNEPLTNERGTKDVPFWLMTKGIGGTK